MARYRWTLGLILICLPILATVITAFRVRDLPRSEDSSKYDRKPKCSDCDVKFGHSVKIESDKQHEDLKNSVRVKNQKSRQEANSNNYLTSSDESDEEDARFNNLKVKPVVSKLKTDSSNKKFSGDHNTGHVIDQESIISKKASKLGTKVNQKLDQDLHGSKVKVKVTDILKDDVDHASEFTVEHDTKYYEVKPNPLPKIKHESKLKPIENKLKPLIKNDDDENIGKKRILTTKAKPLEIKKNDFKSKVEILDSVHVSNENEDKSIDDDKSDDQDDDDKDDDDDDEDDEDDDGVLSSLWETFSMLGLDIDPSLKPIPKLEKQEPSKLKIEKEIDNKDKNENHKLNVDNKAKVIKKTNHFVTNPEVPKKAKEKPFPNTVVKIDDVDNEDINDSDEKEHNNKPSSKINEKNTQNNVIIKNDKFAAVIKENRNKEDADDDDDNDDDEDDDDRYEGKILIKTQKNVIALKEEEKHNLKNIDVANSRVQYYKKNDGKDDDDNEDDDDDDNEDDDDDENDTVNVVSNKFVAKEIITDKGKGEPLLPKIKDINVPRNKTVKNVQTKNPNQKGVLKHDSEIIKNDKDEKDNKVDKLGNNKLSKDAGDTQQIMKDTKVKEDKKETNIKKKDGTNLKTKDKMERIPHQEEPKKPDKGSVSSSVDKNDDAKEGLNIPEIKKEIKAQIRLSRDDKKLEKKSKEKVQDSPEISSTESYLKHVTEALHRRNLLKSEFEDFYAFFPTFAPNFSRIHNPECRRHGQIVLRQLRGTKLWALNMLDATAKIPSGILQGNGIQLGDFDQCVQSRARVQLESGSVVKVQGKYCLARLDIKAEHQELETPVHLAQAKNLMRSRIDDPGHFVPRFSTLSWGLCVPDVCKPEDVELVIKDSIKHYQKTSGVIVRIKVDEQDCHIEEVDWWKDWIEIPTVLTLSFYAIIVLFVLVATLQDFIGGKTNDSEEEEEKKKNDKEKEIEQKKDSFISSFSLYRTVDKLLAPGTGDDISCIHGIRGISTIALLIAHKFLPVAGMPYTNRLKVTETVSSPLWSWCRAGWMYTDCFLLLSGALTSHKASATDNAAPRRLFSRYLRLSPALLAVVLFYAYIWDNISVGPMWGTYVTKNAQICQEGWWWNLLYVQNYFSMEDMCAPQTHQLALDMQLTIVGSVLLWVMQVKQGVYKFCLPVLHLVAAYSRYTTVRDHRLTMLAYHGVSVSQLYRTARLSYTSLVHRSTPYLVGISLGLALKNPAEHGKFLLGVGWLSSIALWCLVWWAGADSGSAQYRYQATFAAQYAALAPVAAALAVAWVIYAVHSAGNGFLSRFLCCRFLVFISRLSYALYLTQFIVFITNVATVKTSSEFTLMSLIDIQEISFIFLLSIILTLTLIIPMQSLNRVFTFSTNSAITRKLSVEEENILVEGEKQENHRPKETNNIELPQMKIRQHLIAHREVLEEIPEIEIEYESQRDNDGLGEILEEEEDEETGEESMENIDMDDELEVIEEEQGGEDDVEGSSLNRRSYTQRRSYSNDDEQDLDEWEWTTNSSRNGAQLYRYSR